MPVPASLRPAPGQAPWDTSEQCRGQGGLHVVAAREEAAATAGTPRKAAPDTTAGSDPASATRMRTSPAHPLPGGGGLAAGRCP